MVGRGVKMSLVIAPLMIASYFVGLPYGPKGVATVYSVVMVLWLVPVVVWSLHGTVVSVKDVLIAVSRPMISSAVAAAAALGVCSICPPSHWAKLLIGGAVLAGVYFGMILYVMGQKTLYADLLQRLVRRSPVEEEALTSVQ
jgi:PST family polysaccharide transporter